MQNFISNEDIDELTKQKCMWNLVLEIKTHLLKKYLKTVKI